MEVGGMKYFCSVVGLWAKKMDEMKFLRADSLSIKLVHGDKNCGGRHFIIWLAFCTGVLEKYKKTMERVSVFYSWRVNDCMARQFRHISGFSFFSYSPSISSRVIEFEVSL